MSNHHRRIKDPEYFQGMKMFIHPQLGARPNRRISGAIQWQEKHKSDCASYDGIIPCNCGVTPEMPIIERVKALKGKQGSDPDAISRSQVLSLLHTDEFAQAARPLMKWLSENNHPHCSVIVTSSNAELVESNLNFTTTDYIHE